MEKHKTSNEWTSKNDSGEDLWRWDDGGVCVSPVSRDLRRLALENMTQCHTWMSQSASSLHLNLKISWQFESKRSKLHSFELSELAGITTLASKSPEKWPKVLVDCINAAHSLGHWTWGGTHCQQVDRGPATVTLHGKITDLRALADTHGIHCAFFLWEWTPGEAWALGGSKKVAVWVALWRLTSKRCPLISGEALGVIGRGCGSSLAHILRVVDFSQWLFTGFHNSLVGIPSIISPCFGEVLLQRQNARSRSQSIGSSGTGLQEGW